MKRTFLPASRHISAMDVAVKAARSRRGAGVSEVATTTTARFMPSAPRSFSMNSRTSRPRSPTRATTTTSASEPRVTMPMRVDFPTPDPAKSPILWPRPKGIRESMARTPVRKGWVMRLRFSGCGGSERWFVRRSAGRRPSPSKGRPRASRTRPSISGPGFGSGGRWLAATSQPTWRPFMSPSGIRRRRCSRKPTTSACTLNSERGERTRQSSPKPTFGPSDSMTRPVTAVTVPTRCTGGRCRTWERIVSTRGSTEEIIRRRGCSQGRRAWWSCGRR